MPHDAYLAILRAHLTGSDDDALQRAYDDDKRLLTEHAQLDDDGDGRGSGTHPLFRAIPRE